MGQSSPFVEAWIADLFAFLRFPSVSTSPEHAADVAACGKWLCEKLNGIGLKAALHPTPGHPIIMAKNEHVPGRKSVLIYGHYDVQPPDPIELWTHPPFEPHLEGGIVTARGATDNKGQILAHILGVQEALRGGGELPVNLTFLIEGEEEIGSPNLDAFLMTHRHSLSCDVIAVSDTGMVGRGIPTLTYGLRGIAAMEIKVTGPSIDLHSGIYGGAVANPATMLARILATLHDAGGRVAVPGFYDDVTRVGEAERRRWESLPLTDALFLELTGAPELSGEAGYGTLERVWARPTVEVNGITAGYQGHGTKTVIPKEASAKLTFRLVPEQKPDEILRLVKKFLLETLPRGVRLETTEGHSGAPYITDPDSASGEAARRALQRTFGSEVALIREGGSIPIVESFRKILDADTLLLGLALPDCRAHAPNENFPLENFFAGIRLNQELLRELALTSG